MWLKSSNKMHLVAEILAAEILLQKFCSHMVSCALPQTLRQPCSCTWLAAAHSDVPTQCHMYLVAEILAAEILLQTGC